MPPTAASAKPCSVVVSVTSERLRQHRPVGDQGREHELRARQHVRRNVAPAHHRAPQHHAEPEHDERQQHAQRAVGARSRLVLWPRFGHDRLPPPPHRGGQRVRDQPAVARIVGRGAEAFIAWKRRVNRELGEHPAGPRRHHHDPLREVDRLEHRMGDEHHGLAQRLPQRQEVVVEAKARDLVERGERLVHQQQRGLGDQRARDRGAHLHPARKLARIALREAGKPDARERRVDARRRIGR